MDSLSFPRVMYHFPSPAARNEDRESKGVGLFPNLFYLSVYLSLLEGKFCERNATEVSTDQRKCFFPRIPH